LGFKKRERNYITIMYTISTTETFFLIYIHSYFVKDSKKPKIQIFWCLDSERERDRILQVYDDDMI